jgi:putative transposase
LNPERVTLPTRSYARYRWSSYRATAGLARAPGFLARERVLSLFSADPVQAERSYRAFVRAGLGRCDPKAERVGGLYLADKPFLRRKLACTSTASEVPRAQREPLASSLERLLRDRSDESIALAYREHGYRLREIAAELGVHYSTVSRRLKAAELALGLP